MIESKENHMAKTSSLTKPELQVAVAAGRVAHGDGVRSHGRGQTDETEERRGKDLRHHCVDDRSVDRRVVFCGPASSGVSECTWNEREKESGTQSVIERHFSWSDAIKSMTRDESYHWPAIRIGPSKRRTLSCSENRQRKARVAREFDSENSGTVHSQCDVSACACVRASVENCKAMAEACMLMALEGRW